MDVVKDVVKDEEGVEARQRCEKGLPLPCMWIRIRILDETRRNWAETTKTEQLQCRTGFRRWWRKQRLFPLLHQASQLPVLGDLTMISQALRQKGKKGEVSSLDVSGAVERLLMLAV